MNFLLLLIKLFSLGVTAEALRANIDWKSAFSKGVHGQFQPKFHVVWESPPRTILALIDRSVNTLQLVADSTLRKKLCSRLSSKSAILGGKRPFFVFQPPL